MKPKKRTERVNEYCDKLYALYHTEIALPQLKENIKKLEAELEKENIDTKSLKREVKRKVEEIMDEFDGFVIQIEPTNKKAR